MRREFILVLLGIICISTLSSLLSGYVQIETDKILLDTVVGAVGAGNFSYWQLGHTGPLLVELTSLSGDADLYVSDTVRPSYETDKNNFSSVTCGPDMVNIPSEFPRPIGIGVFGHWSHYLSEYSIQVFLDTSAVLSEEQVLAIERAHRGLGEKYGELDKRKEKPATRKTDEEPKPRFLKLLSILDMIFEISYGGYYAILREYPSVMGIITPMRCKEGGYWLARQVVYCGEILHEIQLKNGLNFTICMVGLPIVILTT